VKVVADYSKKLIIGDGTNTTQYKKIAGNAKDAEKQAKQTKNKV